MPSLREQVQSRLNALHAERSSWLAHWRELSSYILPRRGRFLDTDVNKGNKRNTNIIDNTATLAARNLASGMMSGITSPARPWFRLVTPDPELMEFTPVRVWLGDVERIMREVFSRSNTYNTLHVMYGELGTFGTAVMLVVKDFDDVIRCYPFTIGSYALATDNRLQVDTVYRKVRLTAGQVVREFGKQRVSNTVRQMVDKGNLDGWVPVIHAIEPNREREPGVPTAQGKPWRSVWFEEMADGDKPLRVSGFDELPMMAPRWEVTGNDIYGRSPGMDALGDVKQLQVMQKEKGKAIVKMVNPPMVAPASLKNTPTTTLPGGVTYVDVLQGQQGFQPAYQVNFRVAELAQDIQETQARIKRAFYEDLFLMLAASDRREITAREVEERHQEKLLMLGPVLERLHNELLDPLIDRTFAIALRAGIFPDPPPELQGVALRVEYISMLAQAQKAVSTGSIERLAGFAGNLAAVNPDVLDKIDMDQMVDEYSDMLVVPPRIMRSDEDVAALREQRAQAQAAQQAQQAAEAANAAAQGAKTLSETQVGETSALDRLLGVG